MNNNDAEQDAAERLRGIAGSQSTQGARSFCAWAFGLTMTLTRTWIGQLLSRPDAQLSFWQTVVWWEKRRIFYNLVVGATGIFTSICMVGIALFFSEVLHIPCEWPDPPLFLLAAVFAYGIAANICYTGGWICEWITTRIWAQRAGSFGEIVFALGSCFSILLTLLPIPCYLGLCVLTAIVHRKP